MKKNLKNQLIRLAKYLFVILILYYVSRFMIRSIRELDDITIEIKWGYILAAFGFHVLYLVTRASIWHYITYINKINLRYWKAVSIWFVSLLGKFIPGKVFYLGARVYYYKKHGKSAALVSYSFFLEYMTSIAASILIFVLSFSLVPDTSFHQYRGLGIILVLMILVSLNPFILNKIVGIANKIFKRNIPAFISTNYVNVLVLTAMYLFAWCLMGLGFFCIVNSIYSIPVADFLYVTGSFALATIIGILSLFAPSGIGVREAVIIATMSPIVPLGVASIISVMARLWATSSELLWVLLVYISSKIFLPDMDKLMDSSRSESYEIVD